MSMCFLSKLYMLMHEPVIYKYYSICSNEHTNFRVQGFVFLFVIMALLQHLQCSWPDKKSHVHPV